MNYCVNRGKFDVLCVFEGIDKVCDGERRVKVM